MSLKTSNILFFPRFQIPTEEKSLSAATAEAESALEDTQPPLRIGNSNKNDSSNKRVTVKTLQKPNIIPVELWQSSSGDVTDISLEHLNISSNGDVDGKKKSDEVEASPLSRELISSSAASDNVTDVLPVLAVFGGMDAIGNFFNDLLVTKLDDIV